MDPTSEAGHAGGQAIGIWETHGLITRIDKANFTTICNRKLCSTSALTEERLQKSLAARFLNGDVAKMVERSLSMREVRGSMPRISNFSEEHGNRKRNYGKLFCWTKRRHGFVRPIWERKHLKQYRACWKSDCSPESPRFNSERRRRKHKFYWQDNQSHPSDINSSCGPHQRGMSIGRASEWHVRNTWIDDPHRQSQYYNDMQ